MTSSLAVTALASVVLAAAACSGASSGASGGGGGDGGGGASPSPDSGAASPDAATIECHSLKMTSAQCRQVDAMILPEAAPASHGNAHADDPAATNLGYALFFDLNAVSSENIRCASCHLPEHGFASTEPMARGLAVVGRNAPALVNAAWVFPFFWDGRADSLWSQSLLTMERDDEMAGSRLRVAHHVQTRYRSQYEAAFGPMPALDDAARFPADGKPGAPAWEGMAAADRATVTGIYVNVGKSFEAYLRAMRRRGSAVDRFLLGDTGAITDAAKAGLSHFVALGCPTCHAGSAFSDGAFHHLDPPTPSASPDRELAAADTGRSAGLTTLATSEFNATSPYYDLQPGETVSVPSAADAAAFAGRFRTPSLRNVVDTAPYGHTGVFPTLEAIVRFHLGGGGPDCKELTAHAATDAEVAELVEFLTSVRGDDAPLPWSAWPGTQAYDGGAD
jgi:cytochrome c peroxidase